MGGRLAQLAEDLEPLFAWGQVKARVRGAQKGRLPIEFFPYQWDEEPYDGGMARDICTLLGVCSPAC